MKVATDRIDLGRNTLMKQRKLVVGINDNRRIIGVNCTSMLDWKHFKNLHFRFYE